MVIKAMNAAKKKEEAAPAAPPEPSKEENSWVGTGQNLPISAEQLKIGLAAGTLGQLAQSAGLSEGATASALAGLLPTVIDTLTPGGAP